MSDSKPPAPLNPLYMLGRCVAPSRTAGALGINDAGDPNRRSMFGDTPGVLGWGDLGAPSSGPWGHSIFFVPQGPDWTLTPFFPLCGGPLAAPAGTTITLDMLKAAASGQTDEYLQTLLVPMNDYATVYSVNTKLRIAHFLAQIGHESNFKIGEENGRYSAKRMHQIFGCKVVAKKSTYDAGTDDCKLDAAGNPQRLRAKLWTEEDTYALNAKNLLSYVYASRFGNGDEASGDGYRYRGRGMMQLTFKDNYAAFTKAHNQKNPEDQRDFTGNPDLLTTSLAYGLESAFYFWDSRSINALADADDINKVTVKINGGTNGLTDRQARLDKLKKLMGIT